MATAVTAPKDNTIGSKGVFNIGPFLGTVYDVYFKHGIAIRNCKGKYTVYLRVMYLQLFIHFSIEWTRY